MELLVSGWGLPYHLVRDRRSPWMCRLWQRLRRCGASLAEPNYPGGGDAVVGIDQRISPKCSAKTKRTSLFAIDLSGRCADGCELPAGVADAVVTGGSHCRMAVHRWIALRHRGGLACCFARGAQVGNKLRNRLT